MLCHSEYYDNLIISTLDLKIVSIQNDTITKKL